MKKVTNSDIGGGEPKFWHYHGDVIFEWPLNTPLAFSNGYRIDYGNEVVIHFPVFD